ncbi:hypothetical protein ACFU9Y_30880 [Streptomyces sp. NPDC057621]|uniref:hypothetical protein n=1 Tax=Streptomyces sp. NPDC057621 TaxID=3346186 RepID=UPI0036ACDA61
MNRVLDLAREFWSGRWEPVGGPSGERGDGYRDCSDTIPLLYTTLPRLQAEGPLGVVWWRCGHRARQTLTDVLVNGDGIEVWQRRDAERRRAQEARSVSVHGRTAADVIAADRSAVVR